MSVFYLRRKVKAWFDYHVQAATGGPGLCQGIGLSGLPGIVSL